MDDIQTRIAWNSALNNAVNLVATFVSDAHVDDASDPTLIRWIEKWQSFFFKNLKDGPPQPKAVNREAAREAGKVSAENEAGHETE